jgi:hypothetical protein
MAPNTHKAGQGTKATFITPEMKEKGVIPAQVAAAERTSGPTVVKKGGVTVEMYPGATPVTPVATESPSAPAPTNAGAPVGGAALPTAPTVAHVTQPTEPAVERSQARVLTGLDAVEFASAYGLPTVESAKGKVKLEDAASMAMKKPDSVWLQLSTDPAPEQSPVGDDADEADDDDEDVAEDTREVMAYARHAGTPLSVEIRGTATILSPARLKVAHEYDDKAGVSMVSIEPEAEGEPEADNDNA